MTITIDSSRVFDLEMLDLNGLATIALNTFLIDESQVLLEDIKGQIKQQIEEEKNVQKNFG